MSKILNKAKQKHHAIRQLSYILPLAACGGGEGTGAVSQSTSRNVLLTGDAFIDGLNFGMKYDQQVLNISISGGMDGEYWVNAASTLAYFGGIVDNTLKFTNVDYNVLGSFRNPEAAALAGADITLVPYISNSLDMPYGVLGFAYPVGFQNIDEFASLPNLYDGIEGDIFLNFGGVLGDVNLSFEEGSEGYLLVLHELGHSLGLKHPHNTIGDQLSFSKYGKAEYDLDEFTVMSYNDNSNSYVSYDPITPMVLDVIALQFMYGKNQDIHSGNTVHEIVHTGTYYTIWDPSGVDTVDLTNSNWDWYVELPSVIASSTHNEYVGFALTDNGGSAPTDLVWLIGDIENLSGGAGDDILIGNHLDNNINGGLGNDDIYSVGGNNTLVGGSGIDSFNIQLSGGYNVIKDFSLSDDLWAITDENWNDVGSLTWQEEVTDNGDLIYVWYDNTTLVFEDLYANSLLV